MAQYVVAVTGGTGFVACEIIKQLLEKGYFVRATTRDKSDEDKVTPLKNLANALPGKESPSAFTASRHSASLPGLHYFYYFACRYIGALGR